MKISTILNVSFLEIRSSSKQDSQENKREF